MAKLHLSDFINKKLKDIGYDSDDGFLKLKFEGNMILKVGRVGEPDFHIIKEAVGVLAEEQEKDTKAAEKAGKKARSEAAARRGKKKK